MSVTGQVGYVSVAKQSAKGTPNATSADYAAVKITGDSLTANNNMLVAEGEIGTGRDVSQAVPGGFSSAGAINGNLRARAAAVFLEGALGGRAVVPADEEAVPPTTDVDEYTPEDDLPYLTIEKKVGTTGSQRLLTQYNDAMVNTLNISVPSGGLATFSAGIVACGETELADPVDASVDYDEASDELLLFHGGRIRQAATGVTLTNTHDDSTFQSIEVVINNNIQSDEYTIRPSRFLRDLTEGIRTIELNLTIVFEDKAKYEQYTYGAAGRTYPGYSLYMGGIEFFLGNWQVVSSGTAADDQDIATETIPSGPTNPQGVQIHIPKLAFAGLPVALSTGRIAVTTTARALKPASGDILTAVVRPTDAGL